LGKAKRQPYERLESESAKAFEAFSKYRDMGIERSLRKVAQELSKSETIIKRWSGQHDWVERVKSFDAEMDRKALIQEEKNRKDMVKRHASLATVFQSKVYERLQKLNPDELSPSELIRWADLAVKMERTARGEPSEITSLEHGGEVKQSHEHSFEEDIEKYAEWYDRIRDKKT
jgi:hypothetical protein